MFKTFMLIYQSKANLEGKILFGKAWFPYDRKESQGIAASCNKSDQVCLRLSAIIWKPAKTLFATPCDSLRSLSQAVAEIENFLSLRLTATRCDPLRLME